MRTRYVMILIFIMELTHIITAVAQDKVTWSFDYARTVTEAKNFETWQIKDGCFVGKSLLDSYFFLAMPPGFLDARRLTVLSVRLFSSAPDQLQIYYVAQNGDWCLGHAMPIKEGWQTYTVNLNEVQWHKNEASGPEAATWGGREKTVTTLRIDPGSSAGREVKIDWVELSDPEKKDATAGGAGSTKPPDPATAMWYANVIRNGSFEKPDADRTGQPSDWQIEARGITTVVESKSLRIEGGNGGGKATLSSTCFELNLTGEYRLAFNYQPIRVEQTANIKITLQFLDVFGQALKETVSINPSIKPTADWQTFAQTVAVPELAAAGRLVVEFVSAGPSRMLLNDFSLKPELGYELSGNLEGPAL